MLAWSWSPGGLTETAGPASKMTHLPGCPGGPQDPPGPMIPSENSHYSVHGYTWLRFMQQKETKLNKQRERNQAQVSKNFFPSGVTQMCLFPPVVSETTHMKYPSGSLLKTQCSVFSLGAGPVGTHCLAQTTLLIQC